MVSPLKDNKGAIRYVIGARVDVTHLIEGGKTLDSFHQLLAGDRPVTPMDPLENRPTLRALRDFAGLLNDEEVESMRDGDRIRIESRPSTPKSSHSPTRRRFVGIEERISQDGFYSRYPRQISGVYQNVCHILHGHFTPLTLPVYSRPSSPISPHSVHVPLPSHPRSLPIETWRSHWRP